MKNFVIHVELTLNNDAHTLPLTHEVTAKEYMSEGSREMIELLARPANKSITIEMQGGHTLKLTKGEELPSTKH